MTNREPEAPKIQDQHHINVMLVTIDVVRGTAPGRGRPIRTSYLPETLGLIGRLESQTPRFKHNEGFVIVRDETSPISFWVRVSWFR